MIQQFLEEAMVCVTAVQQAVEINDREALGEDAHGLKGICRNMGVQELADIAATLEQQCQANSLADKENMLRDLKTGLQRIKRALNADLC